MSRPAGSWTATYDAVAYLSVVSCLFLLAGRPDSEEGPRSPPADARVQVWYLYPGSHIGYHVTLPV